MNITDRQLRDEPSIFERIFGTLIAALTLWGFLPEHKKH